jgi:hypothetical protein
MNMTLLETMAIMTWERMRGRTKVLVCSEAKRRLHGKNLWAKVSLWEW